MVYVLKRQGQNFIFIPVNFPNLALLQQKVGGIPLLLNLTEKPLHPASGVAGLFVHQHGPGGVPHPKFGFLFAHEVFIALVIVDEQYVTKTGRSRHGAYQREPDAQKHSKIFYQFLKPQQFLVKIG